MRACAVRFFASEIVIIGESDMVTRKRCFSVNLQLEQIGGTANHIRDLSNQLQIKDGVFKDDYKELAMETAKLKRLAFAVWNSYE